MFRDIRFQASTAQTLNEVFNYNFHKFERPLKRHFKRHCSAVLDQGGNEFDAASAFMCEMITSMSDIKSHSNIVLPWVNQITVAASYGRLESVQVHAAKVQSIALKELSNVLS